MLDGVHARRRARRAGRRYRARGKRTRRREADEPRCPAAAVLGARAGRTVTRRCAASSTSSRIVTAVTSGPAPGPENPAGAVDVAQAHGVGRMVAARERCAGGTKAGPTKRESIQSRPRGPVRVPRRVSPRRQVPERARDRWRDRSIPVVSMASSVDATSGKLPDQDGELFGGIDAANVVRGIRLGEAASLRLGQASA